MNDDDRIRYLALDPTGAVADRDERAELDAVADLLASPDLWAEPRPEVEGILVALIARASHNDGAPVGSGPLSRRRHRARSMLLAAAAAVAVTVGVIVVVVNDRDRSRHCRWN